MVRGVWWSAFAVGLLAAAAGAQRGPGLDSGESTTGAQVAPRPDGLRVYVDPASGEIIERPGVEQMARRPSTLSEALSQESVDLVPFYLSGEGRGVFLRGRFQSALTARLDSAGHFAFSCVDNDQLGVPRAAEPTASSPAELIAEVK